ncbi:MAG: nuclear transport factor 2 family protein [Chloroflexia bacterium]
MSTVLRAKVLEAEERLLQAQLHSDVTALNELVSPELHFTSHLGQVFGKEDELAFHRSGVFRLKESMPSEQHIQLHDGFAVVSVLVRLIGTYEGNAIDDRIRYTRVWALSPSGSLQLIAGHASAVQSI